jgi:uncharacterized membrane protein
MIPLVGITLVAMVGMLALAVDFGRLESLKSDLQTSADAAALAGAVEFVNCCGHNPLQADLAASAWVAKNPAMQASVSVDLVQCGRVDDGTPGVLWPGSCTLGVSNAVKITVSRQGGGLFMSVLGVTPPTLRATAVAAMRPDLVDPFACTPLAMCRVYLVSNR